MHQPEIVYSKSAFRLAGSGISMTSAPTSDQAGPLGKVRGVVLQ